LPPCTDRKERRREKTMLKRTRPFYPRVGTRIYPADLLKVMKARGWKQTGGGGFVADKNVGEVDMDFARGIGKNRKTVMVEISAATRTNPGNITRVSVDWDKKYK